MLTQELFGWTPTHHCDGVFRATDWEHRVEDTSTIEYRGQGQVDGERPQEASGIQSWPVGDVRDGGDTTLRDEPALDK